MIDELGLTSPLAVRLDSGDLATLAGETRRLLDAAGLADVRIFVSGGLDEYDLERFRRDRVPIDAAGIGTRLGVSANAPSLDSAYKLVAYDDRPVLKLSPGKATLAGPKQVWGPVVPITEDILSSRGEPCLRDHEPLLLPVMQRGVRTAAPDTLDAARLGWPTISRPYRPRPSISMRPCRHACGSRRTSGP